MKRDIASRNIALALSALSRTMFEWQRAELTMGVR